MFLAEFKRFKPLPNHYIVDPYLNANSAFIKLVSLHGFSLVQFANNHLPFFVLIIPERELRQNKNKNKAKKWKNKHTKKKKNEQYKIQGEATLNKKAKTRNRKKELQKNKESKTKKNTETKSQNKHNKGIYVSWTRLGRRLH